jgi:hypothetical protein
MGKTSRYPSTGEYEYAAIAARAPRLKELHHAVNRARSGEICSFKRATATDTQAHLSRCGAKPYGEHGKNPACANCKCFASGLRATYSKLRSRPDIFPRSSFTWMPLLTVCRSQHKNAEANKKSSPSEGLELAVTAGANCGCAQRVSRIFKLDAAPDAAAMLLLSLRETERHHCPASVRN